MLSAVTYKTTDPAAVAAENLRNIEQMIDTLLANAKTADSKQAIEAFDEAFHAFQAKIEVNIANVEQENWAIAARIEQVVSHIEQTNNKVDDLHTYQHDVAKRAQVIKQLAHVTADGAVQSRQASEEQRASIDELSRTNHALAELSEHLRDVIKHFHI